MPIRRFYKDSMKDYWKESKKQDQLKKLEELKYHLRRINDLLDIK